MAQVVCSVCQAKGGGLLGASKWFYRILARDYCETCAEKFADEATGAMVATTTAAIAGHQILAYHGVEAVEVYVDATANVEQQGPPPYLGGASPLKGKERRLALTRYAALRALKVRTLERGGNGLLGVSFQYFSAPDVGLGVAAVGTVVT